MTDEAINAKVRELQRAYSEAEAAAKAIPGSTGQAKHAAFEGWDKKNAEVRRLGEELRRLKNS